jgi:hypothetical protein
MTDKEFLNWIITRLTNMFGDDPNADFIHRLRKIADKIDYLDKSEDGQVFVHINNKLTGTNIAYDCSISELKLLTEFILETIGEKK